MRRVLSHSISIPLLILALSALPTPSPDGDLVARARYEITGGTEVEREQFEEVHHRYLDAGMTLPAHLTVVFTDDLPSCRGYKGLYIFTTDTIRFCKKSDEDWVVLGKLIMHELGHAWDDANMTEERRSAFLRHLESTAEWLDGDLPHNERPGERLAAVVAGVVQGLISSERLAAITGGEETR
jgi:hypothetical protein